MKVEEAAGLSVEEMGAIGHAEEIEAEREPINPIMFLFFFTVGAVLEIISYFVWPDIDYYPKLIGASAIGATIALCIACDELINRRFLRIFNFESILRFFIALIAGVLVFISIFAGCAGTIIAKNFFKLAWGVFF